MPREIELATVAVLEDLLGPSQGTPDWLIRPGKTECVDQWPLVCDIYKRLSGRRLPDLMRSVEHRKVDGVFAFQGPAFVFELDESQHFNTFRATTLRCYPDDLALGFDKELWLRKCQRKTKLEGGRFAIPKPPLFDGSNGRHKQRAFRDALSDIVPLVHGFLPTLRLGDFEVAGWISKTEARDRMSALIDERLGGHI